MLLLLGFETKSIFDFDARINKRTKMKEEVKINIFSVLSSYYETAIKIALKNFCKVL